MPARFRPDPRVRTFPITRVRRRFTNSRDRHARLRALMAGRRTLDHATAWSATRRILDRFSTALLAEAAIDDCLDVLVDALGADRGLLLLPLGDQGEIVVNAR